MSSIEEFGKNVRAAFKALQSANKGSINSNAVRAVLLAAELGIKAVVEKHPKRGDSWDEMFNVSSCFNLSGAKVKRVEILLDGLIAGELSHAEVAEELTEEGVDAIVYIAFGLWKIGRL